MGVGRDYDFANDARPHFDPIWRISCGAARRCSAPWCGASATSRRRKKPCRRRSWRRRCSGPQQGVPRILVVAIHVAARRMNDGIRADWRAGGADGGGCGGLRVTSPWVPAPDSGEAEEQDDTLLRSSCASPVAHAAVGDRSDAERAGRADHREIARAFLVPEATMAEAHQRAKKQIRLREPDSPRRPTRNAAPGSMPCCTCCI